MKSFALRENSNCHSAMGQHMGQHRVFIANCVNQLLFTGLLPGHPAWPNHLCTFRTAVGLSISHDENLSAMIDRCTRNIVFFCVLKAVHMKNPSYFCNGKPFFYYEYGG